MALLNRGTNPSRVCFLLENVESIAGHSGDCSRKQAGYPHAGAKENIASKRVPGTKSRKVKVNLSYQPQESRRVANETSPGRASPCVGMGLKSMRGGI